MTGLAKIFVLGCATISMLLVNARPLKIIRTLNSTRKFKWRRFHLELVLPLSTKRRSRHRSLETLVLKWIFLIRILKYDFIVTIKRCLKGIYNDIIEEFLSPLFNNVWVSGFSKFCLVSLFKLTSGFCRARFVRISGTKSGTFHCGKFCPAPSQGAKCILIPLPHRCRSGRRSDFGSQSKFQDLVFA